MAAVRLGRIVCVFVLLSSTSKAEDNVRCTFTQHRALEKMFSTLPETYVLMTGLENFSLFPGVRFSHALLTELDGLVSTPTECVRGRKISNRVTFKTPINIVLPWETSCPGESGNLTVSLVGVQIEALFRVEANDSETTIRLVSFYNTKVDSISISMDGSGSIAHTLMSVLEESLGWPLKSQLLKLVASALKNMFTEAAKLFTEPA